MSSLSLARRGGVDIASLVLAALIGIAFVFGVVGVLTFSCWMTGSFGVDVAKSSNTLVLIGSRKLSEWHSGSKGTGIVGFKRDGELSEDDDDADDEDEDDEDVDDEVDAEVEGEGVKLAIFESTGLFARVALLANDGLFPRAGLVSRVMTGFSPRAGLLPRDLAVLEPRELTRLGLVSPPRLTGERWGWEHRVLRVFFGLWAVWVLLSSSFRLAGWERRPRDLANQQHLRN